MLQTLVSTTVCSLCFVMWMNPQCNKFVLKQDFQLVEASHCFLLQLLTAFLLGKNPRCYKWPQLVLGIQISKAIEKSGREDLQTQKKRATAAWNNSVMCSKSFDGFHIGCRITTAEPIKGQIQWTASITQILVTFLQRCTSNCIA